MPREIKFRGKSANNEFVYGDLRHDYPDTTAYYDEYPHRICWYLDNGGSANAPVKKGTVGQYAGLKDKNGVEIYEGDILRYPAKDKWEEKSYVGYEVFFHDNDCASHHVGFQMNRMHFYGNLCGGECEAWFLPKYTSRMEVIGNIHDNPSLLEGEPNA